jgi:hypothetical protein
MGFILAAVVVGYVLGGWSSGSALKAMIQAQGRILSDLEAARATLSVSLRDAQRDAQEAHRTALAVEKPAAYVLTKPAVPEPPAVAPESRPAPKQTLDFIMSPSELRESVTEPDDPTAEPLTNEQIHARFHVEKES